MKNAWLVPVMILAAQPALAASFSCQKAVTVDEHAICDDPRLSQLDDLLPSAYRAAKTAASTDAPQVARDFLVDRRSCGADMSCIMSTYLAVLGAYRDLGAKIDVPTISATTPFRPCGASARSGPDEARAMFVHRGRDRGTPVFKAARPSSRKISTPARPSRFSTTVFKSHTRGRTRSSIRNGTTRSSCA